MYNSKMSSKMATSEVVLYDVKRDNGDCFFLKAYIDSRSSNLVLSGLDYSKLAKKLYDNEEYEYYYTFSKDATEKLKKELILKDIRYYQKHYTPKKSLRFNNQST